MHKLLVLSAVAGADIVRTVWVMNAVLAPGLGGTPSLGGMMGGTIGPWFVAGLILATGGLSLAMTGIVVRAMLEQRHAIPFRRPSS